MDLNIRNFPEELAAEMKREGLERGESLREVVIRRCAGNGSQSRKKAVSGVPTRKEAQACENVVETAYREMQESEARAGSAPVDSGLAHAEGCRCLRCKFKRGELR